MKSLMITKYGDVNSSLEEQEVPKPAVKANQILIKTYSSSFNPIDYKIVSGAYKALGKLSFPAGIGRDVSGIVDEVGKNVRKFKTGDKVYSRINESFVGTMAEYVLSNVEDTALMPLNLGFDESASIPLVGLTTYQALVDVAKLSKGESVLIHAGSGGIGTFAIQLAKHLGAKVTTTTSAKNVSFVKGLGADHVVWGTDTVWYGSPQWQIEAMRRLEVPEDMQKKYGLPSLGGPNSLTKQAIFGLNSARIYGLSMNEATNMPNLPNFSEDKIAGLAAKFREAGGGPSNKRFGYTRKA